MATKKARVQEKVFSVSLTAKDVPESGFLFLCTCGNRWWGSDESWVGCRQCHTLDGEGLEISVMTHDDAVAAGLYCVTTGGLGYAVDDKGNTWGHSLREYPPEAGP